LKDLDTHMCRGLMRPFSRHNARRKSFVSSINRTSKEVMTVLRIACHGRHCVVVPHYMRCQSTRSLEIHSKLLQEYVYIYMWNVLEIKF